MISYFCSTINDENTRKSAFSPPTAAHLPNECECFPERIWSVCVHGCCASNGKKQEKSAGSSRCNPSNHAVAPLSTETVRKVQYHEPIRESFQVAHGQVWEYPPISSASLWWSYSPSMWQHNQRPLLNKTKTPARCDAGISDGWDRASSLTSAGECLAGPRRRGQLIDLVQAHDFRGVYEKKEADWGKTWNKINLGHGPFGLREQWNCLLWAAKLALRYSFAWSQV